MDATPHPSEHVSRLSARMPRSSDSDRTITQGGPFGMREADLPRLPFTAQAPLLAPRVSPFDPLA